MGRGHAQAAGAGGSGAGPACYDFSKPTTRERRTYVVSDTKTLDVGDQAPDFTLKSIGLKEVSLHEFRGKNVVVLFYPLDWTPG